MKKNFIFILVLFTFLFVFKDVFFRREIFFAEDIMRTQVPIRKFVTGEFNNFNFPYWNPHLFCGMPNFASAQSGLFYPPNLILYSLFSVEYAFTLSQVLNFLLAIIFFYLLCKHYKISSEVSLVAGLVFSLSGWSISHYRNAALIASFPYLPIIVLYFIKFLNHKRIKYFVLTSIFFSIQLLAGHPQLPFYTLFTISLYLIYYIIRNGIFSKESLTIISLTFCIFLLSFLLSAFQLLPLYQLVRFTSNTTIDKFSYITFISMPLYLYLQVFFPFFTGMPSFNSYFGPEHFFELTIFFTLTAVFIITITAKRVFFNKELTKDIKFFVLLIIISIFFSLGYHNPFYRFLVYIPGFNFFRVPARYNYLFLFAVSVIFAFGFEEIKKYNFKINKIILYIFIMIGVASLLFSLSLFISQNYILESFQLQFNNQTGFIYNQIQNPTRYDINFFLPKLNRIINFFKYNFLIVSIIYFVNIFIIKIKSKKLLISFFSFVLCIELFLMSLLVLETTHVNFFREPPATVEFLNKTDDFFRIYSWNRGRMYSKFKTYDGYWYNSNPRYFLKKFLHDNYGNIFGIKNFSGDNTLVYPRYRDVERLVRSGNYDILPIFSVKYLLTGININGINAIDNFVDEVIIYEFDTYKNKYYFSNNIMSVDKDTALNKLNKKTYEILHNNLVLVEEFDYKLSHDLLTTDKKDYKPDIEFLDSKNYEYNFKLRTSEPGIFVLNTVYYPEWRAEINGKNTDIYKTNYYVKGIFIEEAGEHKIRFYYAGKYVKIGKYISILSVILVLFICLKIK